MELTFGCDQLLFTHRGEGVYYRCTDSDYTFQYFRSNCDFSIAYSSVTTVELDLPGVCLRVGILRTDEALGRTLISLRGIRHRYGTSVGQCWDYDVE